MISFLLTGVGETEMGERKREDSSNGRCSEVQLSVTPPLMVTPVPVYLTGAILAGAGDRLGHLQRLPAPAPPSFQGNEGQTEVCLEPLSSGLAPPQWQWICPHWVTPL